MLLMPILGAQKLWASNVCGKKQLLLTKKISIGLSTASKYPLNFLWMQIVMYFAPLDF